MERNKRLKIVLLSVCMLLSGAAGGGMVSGLLAYEERTVDREGRDREYVLYIGLNDKEEYRQLISTAEAEKRIHEICMTYVEGYTVTEAKGAWVDEKGNATNEQTLVYSFRGVEKEELINLMDDVLEALNQNTILMEERTSDWNYYGGER